MVGWLMLRKSETGGETFCRRRPPIDLPALLRVFPRRLNFSPHPKVNLLIIFLQAHTVSVVCCWWVFFPHFPVFHRDDVLLQAPSTSYA